MIRLYYRMHPINSLVESWKRGASSGTRVRPDIRQLKKAIGYSPALTQPIPEDFRARNNTCLEKGDTTTNCE